jgi:hypothetical protein
MGLPCLVAFSADTTLGLVGHLLPPIWVCVAWAAIVASLLLLLPDVLAVILTIFVVFGHVSGAYTQLIPLLGGSGWYQIANGMFLAAAIVLGTGLHWYLRGSSKPIDQASVVRWMAGWVRWVWIIALIGAGFIIVIKFASH